MALKSNFNKDESEKDLEKQKEGLYEKILNAFHRAGLKFVTSARAQVQDHSQGTYLDDTTNLRNSIAYYIFHDGKLIEENVVGSAITNLQAIQDIINPKGFQLIGIAGMNYASYVESKGYNVISYQTDVCMIDLAVYLETLEVIEQGTAANIENTFVPE